MKAKKSRMRLYDEFASWWPLLSPPAEYAGEAAFYEQQLIAACDGKAETFLELGSGGGSNASFLKKTFDMTFVDPSPGMLAVSRELNPECEHLEGDMRTVKLGRTFDCVFIHDAIVYMTSETDLGKAIETAYLHCRPGGAALFAPDFIRENFRATTDHGGNDGDGRGMRYLEWAHDPDPADDTYIVDYAYLLKDRDGSVRAEHDRHEEGLFARAVWLRLLADAGFEAKAVRCVGFETGGITSEVFVGKKPR